MATATQAANLFECSCGDTQITYSTTSITGKPQFGYTGPDGNQNFSGDEIDAQSSKLGSEITVTLSSIDDGDTVTITLLLASFKLGADRESDFDTLAIRTTNHSTIAGPPVGPAQSYEAIALHGVAKSVVF